LAPTALSFCDMYTAGQTNTDTVNYPVCGVTASAGQTFVISLCGPIFTGAYCQGVTTLRVFTPTGVEVVYDDTGTGGLPPAKCMYSSNVCAQVQYTVPVGTPQQTYIIREGCIGSTACIGRAVISGVAGVKLVTIHGRTRCQFYKGSANWDAIRAIVDAVSIPVVANGDCASLADASAMLAASGAQGVMIGRAAMGRPWLVGEIAAGLAGLHFEAPSNAQRAEAALEHYEGLLGLFGERGGLRHARKHLAAYADHARSEGGAGAARDRLRLVTSEDTQEVRRLIAHLFTDHPEAEAA
jgi:hypothetical protein